MMHPSAFPSEGGRILQWSEFTGRLFETADPYLEIRGDSEHAVISYGYALTLLQHEGGDRKIVEPAVILHDVGWSALKPEYISVAYGVLANGEEAERLNRIHEIEGAAIAERILGAFNYDPGLIQTIRTIISRHDSGEDVSSLEEALVKDADKLWRFSRTGFWRETERQHLKPATLLEFLAEKCKGWFFSATAVTLARKELVSRKDEINDLPSQGNETCGR
ncbi:MAG: HD domain-containing protein [Deltaproteobacteria bacterium]|nr:HD domain-containing protein [Deltaproteobacteria bacterium]